MKFKRNVQPGEVFTSKQELQELQGLDNAVKRLKMST